MELNEPLLQYFRDVTCGKDLSSPPMTLEPNLGGDWAGGPVASVETAGWYVGI